MCGTLLMINNAPYKLRGIVVLIGTSMMAGQCYAFTCCWETRKAYMLNDDESLITLQDKELEEERNKPDGHYGPTQYITIQYNTILFSTQ